MREPTNNVLRRAPDIGPIDPIRPISGRPGARSSFRRRAGAALALAVMCLGAWVMAYPYLFAFGGSLKSRSEFTIARNVLIPPRLRPSKLIDRYALRHSDAVYDAEMKRWPAWRNYVDAI